jgi:hypothetical protein
LRRMDNKFTPDYITVTVVNKVAVTWSQVRLSHKKLLPIMSQK